MINAEELRIGNFLNIFGTDKSEKVISIYVGEDEPGVNFEPCCYYDPTPFSEQWLLILGFWKRTKNQEHSIYENYCNGIAFIIEHKNILMGVGIG